MIIFFAGTKLDWLGGIADPLVESPITIRGYDGAGNLLSAIRYGPLPNSTLVGGTQGEYGNQYLLNGYTKEGVPISFTINNLYTTSGTYYPKSIAICPVTNHIFCATNVWSAYIAGAYVDVMFDFSKVFRRNGDPVDFPQLHGRAIYAMEIDSSGNIFVGGEPEYVPATLTHYALRKYDIDGTLVWSADTSTVQKTTYGYGYYHFITDITLDSGNIYTVGTTNIAYNIRAEIRKYNSDGEMVWNNSISYSGPFEGLAKGKLAVDSGYVYVGGDRIWKLDDTDGSIVHSIATTYPSYIQFYDGKIHAVYWTSYSYTSYAIYDTDLVQIGTTLTQSRYALNHPIAVDTNGTRYFGGNRTVTETISGLSIYYNLWHFATMDSSDIDQWIGLAATMERGVSSQTGEVRTDATYAAQEYTTAWGGTAGPDQGGAIIGGNVETWGRTTCIKILYDSLIPALPIPLSFGIPTWEGDRYINVPALAIDLALGSVQAWRDYVGARGYPEIYRLYLTGSPTIELPLASLQCRLDVNTLTLTVVVPALTTALVDAIEARLTGELVVYRGLRRPDLTEQIDEMLRVPLDSLRYDLGSQSGSASLQGSIASSGGGRSRTIKGISYRNTLGSTRRVRCAVDTYLRPGDTADLGGGESLTVAEIVYSIGTDQASMEIAE